MSHFPVRRGLLVAFLACGAASRADDRSTPITRLAEVQVTATRRLADPCCPPHVVETVTAIRARETINVVDAEDAVKYLPSIFLRKRNYGDTQPTIASRVWGVSSSARSLVSADGVPLSALLANNNTLGAPRWGMIAPAEIERVDVSYGPFSAAYPGNAMGAVVEITTRLPEKFEAAANHVHAWQPFHLFGTHRTFGTAQTSATVGDRVGPFSFWISGQFQDSESQPLSFVTSAAFPVGTTGGYAARNKTGQPANVLGATGLLHTRMANGKFKAAYDIGPTLRATYTFGFWRNDADASVESYLRDGSGQPTFAGLAGFASGRYELLQEHSMHSVTLRAAPSREWQIDAAASRYRMDHDRQRFPTTVTPSGTSFGSTGRVASLTGTGWTTYDLKAIRRPTAFGAAHTVSFGIHDDRYRLLNPTFNTPDWQNGATTSVATEGDGHTHTQALWAEDIAQLTAALRLTLGVRYEIWRASDGLNVNGPVAIRQPEQRAKRFSPKAALAWTLAPRWTLTGSLARAYRFATPAELYQLVSTGTTFTAPNPELKPDNVLAAEVKLERSLARGRLRLSVFQDDVHDAILAQFNPLVAGSSTLYQFVSNVDHVRARGIEVAADGVSFARRRIEVSGSVTFLDATILATQGRGQFGSAVGKRLPNIPEWRGAFVTTWRPSERWSFTVGGRYSGMMFTTLDNVDVNPNSYQGFGSWFVADIRAHVRVDQHWTAALGVDNALNRKYFLFHPFPQRTFVLDVKCAF